MNARMHAQRTHMQMHARTSHADGVVGEEQSQESDVEAEPFQRRSIETRRAEAEIWRRKKETIRLKMSRGLSEHLPYGRHCRLYSI